jgi:nitroreductase
VSEGKKEAGYEEFLEIVKRRHSAREFLDKPIPEGAIEKILEAARWAMSGANSQPWNYIAITDKEIISKLFEANINENMDFAWWMEQQRVFELRHPGFQVDTDDPDEGLRIKQTRGLWRSVPAVIAVVGDGRKQWGSVLVSHTNGLPNSHMTDALANTSMVIHLAAASLGLNTQWVTIHTEGPFKKILGIPDQIFLHTLIPIGYPAAPVGGSWRERLDTLVHYNKYNLALHLSNKQSYERLCTLRKRTKVPYKKMID